VVWAIEGNTIEGYTVKPMYLASKENVLGNTSVHACFPLAGIWPADFIKRSTDNNNISGPDEPSHRISRQNLRNSSDNSLHETVLPQ
jgi:hypothetical protein